MSEPATIVRFQKSGYCFTLNGENWLQSKDDDWDIEIYTATGEEDALLSRTIDGSEVMVFRCPDSKYRAIVRVAVIEVPLAEQISWVASHLYDRWIGQPWLQAIGEGGNKVVVYCVKWPDSTINRFDRCGGVTVQWVRSGRIRLNSAQG